MCACHSSLDSSEGMFWWVRWSLFWADPSCTIFLKWLENSRFLVNLWSYAHFSFWFPRLTVFKVLDWSWWWNTNTVKLFKTVVIQVNLRKLAVDLWTKKTNRPQYKNYRKPSIKTISSLRYEESCAFLKVSLSKNYPSLVTQMSTRLSLKEVLKHTPRLPQHKD